MSAVGAGILEWCSVEQGKTLIAADIANLSSATRPSSLPEEVRDQQHARHSHLTLWLQGGSYGRCLGERNSPCSVAMAILFDNARLHKLSDLSPNT